MKLFVIGATGRVGREIVKQALVRGHDVTAFVRSPESVTLKNERLTVLKGNVMDENQLFDTMENHDAVLSALGPREVFKPSSLLHDSALATTRAMQRSGVKRLVILSAAAHFPGVPNRIVSFILRNHMRDRWQWKKSCKVAGSTGQSPVLLVSLRKTTSPIEAGRVPRPGWVSVWPAKRLQHSCSMPSSKRNISTKSWASRNNYWSSSCLPPTSLSLSWPLLLTSSRPRSISSATSKSSSTCRRWVYRNHGLPFWASSKQQGRSGCWSASACQPSG